MALAGLTGSPHSNASTVDIRRIANEDVFGCFMTGLAISAS
jgi:hypothetical protein